MLKMFACLIFKILPFIFLKQNLHTLTFAYLVFWYFSNFWRYMSDWKSKCNSHCYVKLIWKSIEIACDVNVWRYMWTIVYLDARWGIYQGGALYAMFCSLVWFVHMILQNCCLLALFLFLINLGDAMIISYMHVDLFKNDVFAFVYVYWSQTCLMFPLIFVFSVFVIQDHGKSQESWW